MGWEQALLAATMAGQFFGMAGRWLPFIPNRLAPKITWAAAFAANLLLVMQRFIEATGWGGVAWYDMGGDGTVLAGFFSLKGFVALVGGAMLAYMQTAFTRWVGEKGAKPVINASGQPGDF